MAKRRHRALLAHFAAPNSTEKGHVLPQTRGYEGNWRGLYEQKEAFPTLQTRKQKDKGSVRFCPSCESETDSQTAPKDPPAHTPNHSKPHPKNGSSTTPFPPPSSIEKRSAVHWPTQRAPIANAARCIVHRTALHQTLYSGTKSARSFCPDTMKTSGQTAKHFNQNKRAI